MSGILAVYGLVIAVLISQDIGPPPDKSYSLFACVNAPAFSDVPGPPSSPNSHVLRLSSMWKAKGHPYGGL